MAAALLDVDGTLVDARKAGVATVCLMTGGWSRQELFDADAAEVHESIGELRQNPGKPPLSFS